MLILYDIDINKNNNINADTIKYILHLKLKKPSYKSSATGGSSGTRTRDTLIKSQVLYHLS